MQASIPFFHTPRQKPKVSDWPLCATPSTLHSTVVCYTNVGGEYRVFIGQESKWLAIKKTDKFKLPSEPFDSNPLLTDSPCTHIVLRCCERTQDTASGKKGTLSESYTVQASEPSSRWGFPKGGNQRAESHADCAIREVFEETNVSLNLAKLSDPGQTPTFAYMSGGLPGKVFFYELSPPQAEEFLKTYALLNLQREGELFHGGFRSLQFVHRNLYGYLNNISRDAFNEFLRLKGISKATLGGSRNRKTRRQQKRKTG
jgi:8-oxo-dGTP pyrophosphatase MutT (NUDIX family)